MQVFLGIITAILLIAMLGETDKEANDKISMAFYVSIVALVLVSIL